MDPDALHEPTLQTHLEQVAAALSPLRASSSRSALANAVARLVTNAAVACRVDVLDYGESSRAPELSTLSRATRPGRSDLKDEDDDLGTEEAVSGRAAVVPDRRRSLSWVVIPLIANRTTAGALRVVLEGAGGPSASELAYLHHIASSLAFGLSSAELHEQSEWVSRRLQESLLPQKLPAAAWFQLAARYVPATAGMRVGGDWYDAQLMDRDVLAISVGDVAGHGVEAAARMGELRSAIHAFRLLSRAPDDVIAQLHRLCDPKGDFATAICARLDVDGKFRWASAGHLPPLLARHNGTVERLSAHQSPPLGTGIEGPVLINHRTMSPGDTMLLYTDGLVERRDEPLDASLDRLCAELASPAVAGRPPDELLDALLANRRDAGPASDDIALVAVRFSLAG